MTQQILLPQPPSVDKLQPPLAGNKSSAPSSLHSTTSSTLGEVAGGATAECAAVVCCCPCTLLNLIVLAAYRFPSRLCQKVLLQRRRRTLKKKDALPRRSSGYISSDSDNFEEAVGLDEDMLRLEKDMRLEFCGSGFWRSHSQSQKTNVDL
ncbi:hypothetical protein NMG60_11008660 [Bertholletia excelsa]